MRYFGSKVSTLDILYGHISSRVPTGSFCDPFGGIGSVGSYFQARGYEVWSGDILKFPHFFQIARLKFSPLFFEKLLAHLGLSSHFDLICYMNSITPKNGWFVKEYAINRMFFTVRNAMQIQSCRLQIQKWAKLSLITYEEHAVLLASLINSMDKVANTAGTYYAFLKTLYRKAENAFKFELIQPLPFESKGFCFNEPAESLVSRKHFDVLYLDPPYNQRSYSHYYHLPETIAQEKTPIVHGMSGIPKLISCVSGFNSPREAKKSLTNVIDSAKFNLLVFHYADDGIIPEKEVKDLLSSYGNVEDFLIDSKGYTTIRNHRKQEHHLYLVQDA